MKMKTRIPAIGRIAVLTSFAALAGCISNPTDSINRDRVFTEALPSVVLPFKVIVDSESRNTEDGIELWPKDYRHYVLRGVPGDPASLAIMPILRSAHLATLNSVQERRIEGFEQDRFPVGEVFENAFQRVSLPYAETGPTMRVELVQYHASIREIPFGKRLFVDLKFKTSFSGHVSAPQSNYWLQHDLRWSDKEYDIVREMIEYAVQHWANQMLSAPVDNGQTVYHFPPKKEASFKTGRAQCSYKLFDQEEQADEIARGNIEKPDKGNADNQH